MQNTQKTIGTLSDLHKADIESLPVLALSARAEKIQWVKTVLNQFAYFTLSREDKGLIREYIQHMTGCSRAQTARYIADTQSAAHEVSASAPVRNIQKSHIASAVLTLALLLLISRSTSPMFASVTHTDSSTSSVANNPVYVAALSQASSKSSQRSYSSATSVRPADRTAAEQLFVLQTFVADRKASRLARLITHNAASAQSSSVLMARPDRGIETKVFPPYPPLSGTHPAASVSLSLKDVLAMLGSGTDGQILQMQGGRPAWVDFPYLQQIRSLAPQGEEPTRRGGGLRNGGAPQNTTNTTIVNNITTGGASAPSGWTEGVGVVYLTDATDFVGIGTDTPDTNLEVVGSISGASLYIASSIEGAGLTACDPVNGKIVWDSVTKQFSCGTDNAVGTGLSIQTADQRYVKKQGDTMTGALVINIQNGNLASVGLNVINTISGAVIHAEKSLTTSGTLVFEGAASGSSLYLGKSLNGAGLVDCSTAGTSKLLWNAASGRFSCGTDTDTNTTYTAGQGLGMNGTIITLNANLSGSLLRFTTISGSTVFANTSLRSSGSLTVAGNTILRGTISGSTLHIEKTLSVSGSIVTEGTISGASLFVGTSITGAGLTTCSNATTSKLLWNAATGRFVCGTDTDTNTPAWSSTGALQIQFDNRYVRTSGGTMTGSLTVARSISGATIHAEKSLTTSGTLVFEGAASGSSLYLGASLNGAGLVDCSTAGTSKLLWNATTGRFGCGTDQNTGIAYTAGQGISVNSNVITLNASISGSLIRFMTISGSTIYGKNSINSSGSITAEGTISGANLFVGTSITGAGLTPCNSATSALQWNAVTGRFSCGTIAAGSSTSSGNVITIGDSRYVRKSGDTMTGALTVAVTNGNRNTIGINVTNTISGAVIHAEKTLSTSGTLVFEGAASGSSLYIASSLQGAGLVDCSTAGTSKLLWNAVSGRFSCGTDTDTNTTYTAGQGLSLNGTVITLNANISGSLIRFTTISGSTVFAKNTLATSGSLIVASNANIRGSLSGSNIHAEKGISASGSITTESTISGANLFIGTGITGAGLTTCSNATTSKLLWNSATGRFSCGTDQNTTAWSSTGALQIQFDNRYVRTSGGTMTGTLNVTRTISGAVIHAEKTLSTSGTLVFEGAASGSSLYIASSLQGAGLVDCSTAGTSKLLWNSVSGRFSCGTDTDTNTTYTAGQGLSLNGTVITLNANISGSLIRFTTISGSTVYAKNSLRSSGSLIVAGTANIRGSFSGSNIHAEKGLTASGNITTEGTISGASLYIGTSINGAGLSDCVGGNKLLWNGTTGRFSCGVDQAAGSGLDQNSADARYVNTSGDTMTGALTVAVTNGNRNTIGINVTNTISGAVIHAEKTLSTSGTLVFEGAASGSSLYIASSLQGAGLVDCSTAGTSKLLWNSVSGRFSCGTDTDTNTTYTAGQGLSLNGTVITLNANISGSLIRFTTISGSTVFAKNALATSGSLIVSGTANIRGSFSGSNIHAEKGISASGSITTEGTISGANLFVGTGITGAGLTTCSNATTSKLLWNSATGRFSCGTDFGTSVGSGQVIAIGDTRYVRKSGDTMTGALIINMQGGTVGSIGLKVLNTFSGAIIHAEKALSSSGTIAAVGNITTKASFSGSSLRTSFGTATTPALQVGTANTGFYQATDGGLALTVGGTTTFEALPSRFLLASGTSGTPSLSFMNNSDVGLYNVGAKLGFSTNGISRLTIDGNGIMSGSVLHLERAFSASGSITTEGTISGANLFVGTGITGAGLTTCSNATTSKLLWNSATGRFSCGSDQNTTAWSSTGSLQIQFDNRYVNTSGDTMTGALAVAVTNGNRNTLGINVANTISGAVIHAEKSLTTSGSLVFEGAASGSSLYLGTSLQGAGLVDCSTAGTSKLLWNAASGRFSCGADQNTTYTAGQGLSLNGTVITLNANISGSLIRFTTISGSTVFAKNTLATSGSLIVSGTANIRGSFSGSTIHAEKSITSSGAITAEGAISGASLYVGTSVRGAGLVSDCNTTTSALQWSSSTGRFSCGTITGSSFSTGNVLTIGNQKYVSKQGDTMTGALTINMQGGNLNTIGLKVINTLSGAQIHAEKNLTSSGTLIVRGTGSFLSGGAGQVALRIIGAGSQSANLTEWTTSAGSKMLAVTSAGDLQQLTNGTWRIKDFSGNDIFSHTNGGLNTFGGGTVGSTFAFSTILGGTADVLAINPSINYAGNGTYTALAINITENSVPTGMRYLAHFKLGGVSKFAVTSTGSVGVGTATPGSRLAVSGAVIINANGNLGSTAADAGVALETIGTISGTTLFANQSLRSSGSIVAEGTISGANLFVGTGITGAGLTTCSNAATSKLLWDAATGRFSCGTDQTGGAGFGSGQVIVIGDTRFVRKSGDVMTGSLIIRSTSGSLGIGLNVVGTMSGIGLHISGTGSYPIMRTFPRTGTVIIGSGSIRGGSGYMLPQLYVPGGRTPVLVGNVSTTAAVDHMAVQGNTIVATAGTVLRSFDISTPTNPKFLSTATVTSSNPASIVMQGKYAFIGVQIRIQSFDVSNPAAIVPLHVFTPTSAVNALAIQGQYLYSLNTTSARFQVIDISNPAQMISRGLVVTGTTPNAVAVQGRYAYITNGGSNTLQTIDLKNPTLPVSLGTVAAGTTPNGVAVQGRFVYVINSAGLQIFDASNPSSVVSVSTLATGAASDIKVSGRYAYIVGTNGFQTVDISDPKAPYLVSTVSTGLTTLNQISLQGRYAYVSYTGGTRLYVYDLGGADIQNAEIGILDAGAVNIRELLQGMDASFQGSVSAGASLIVAGHASFGTGGMVTIGTGGLVVRGPGFSGSSVYAATSIQGAGLTDCSTAGSSKLLWTASTGRFSCGSDQNTNWSGTGALQNQFDNRYVRTSGGTMTGALNVTRSISGAVIHAEKTLSSSGSIVAEGTISGANLYVGTSIRGAGLVTDCNTSGTSALQWTASTGRFSCGSISGGGTFSTGNVLTIGSAKYVSKQGDTMTGSLVINQTTAPTNRSGALVVRNTVSGASGALVSAVDAPVLLLNSNLESRQAPHILFGYKANFDTALWRSSANVLSTNGTFSGTTVYAAKSLRSSGSIVAEGAISGASLYIGTSIRGAGLVTDCNTSTSALQWTASTGRFSCGTISAGSTFSTGNVLTIGSAKYVSRFGDTITGTLKLPAVLFSSGSTLTGGSGFNEFVNLIRGGLATKSITRITADGNLTNIGSIQSGEINATMGGIFAFNKTYPVSSLPRAIDSADYNGDGKPDLALALTNVDQVAVLLNSGTGGFLTAVNYAVGDVPLSIASADYNGDGIPDLAVGNNSDNNVSILINKGNGTFLTAVNYAVGANPNDIEAGDLNNDGLMDLAVVNNQAPSMSILLNRGSGRFAPAVDYTTGSYPTGIAIGDLNGDSKQDIAVSSYNTNKANIFINAGNGTFAAKVDYTVSANSLGAYDVDIGDTNGDKKPDLALVESLGNFVSILRNNGNGTFGTYTTYPTVPGDQPFKVRLADLNGDGKKDVIMNHYLGYNISTYLNTGTGTFPARVDYNVGINPQGFVVQDFNGDGKVDFATALTTDIAAGVYFNTPRTILYASTGTGGFVSIGTAVTKAKLTVTGTISRGTGAYITSSGGTVLALEASTQSGARTPNIAFGYRGNFDTRITRTATGSLRFASNTGTLLTLDTERSDTTGNVFQIISDASTSYGGPDENRVFRIQANGAVFTDGAVTSIGADYAEWFYSGNEKLKAGEVVCIDITKNNSVKRCINAADANIMGIVSTNPAFIGNGISGADGLIPPGYALIGLIGQVPAHVIVEGTGAIRPGDALTSAKKPGYARKALPGESTVGVALEGLTSGEGTVNVLISRRNSSMTVDAVGQKVLDTIASMKIGDEVQLMVASSLENLNVDDQIQTEVRNQVSNLKSYDADIFSLQAEIDDLKNQLAIIKSQTGSTTVITQTVTGSALVADLTAATLVLEQTLTTGGDARIGGDLHIDGTLMASSLFVPNGLTIDGGTTVAGTLAATTITASSGATIDGTLTVNGNIRIHSGALLFDSGSTVQMSDLIVENSLRIVGSITIDGLARFFGNVEVYGELRVSGRQAGVVTVPAGSKSVSVQFSTGFSAVPIITATPNDFVFSAWRVKPVTQTGFTIEFATVQDTDVAFSWHALIGLDQGSTGIVQENTSTVFPMGSDHIPVSSDMFWNACIRNTTLLDADGKPHSCARYHEDFTWHQPDLGIDFLWNTNMTPPLLIVPSGYSIEVTEEEESIRNAFSIGDNEEAPQSSSVASSEESSEQTSSAASSVEQSSSVISSETSSAESSESSASSESLVEELTINPVTPEAEAPVVTEPTPEPESESAPVTE